VQGITIGQYIPGDSIIHKADPRLKIIMTFLTMILLLIIDSFYPLLLSAVFVNPFHNTSSEQSVIAV
jgi:energy-coupling factor transport system permease protein